MARKSKRPREPEPPTPEPPKFRWTRDHVNMLLACLDYSLQQEVDFEGTAIFHIRRRTGHEVTAEQIRKTLRREYWSYGRLGRHYVFEDLLSEGSAFLVGYADIDREDICEEISHIEPPVTRYRLRSTPLASRSRFRTGSSNDHRKRSASSSLSIHATPEFEGLGDHTAPIDNAEKQTYEEQNFQPGVPESRELASRGGSSGPSQAETRTEPLPADVKLEHGRIPVAEVHHAILHALPPTANNDSQLRTLGRQLAAKSEELQRILRENAEQKNYIFSLSSRLSAAEFECGQVRESASKAAKYSDDILMQRDLRYENSVLKGQLEQISSQRQIMALATTDSVRPSDRTIWQELELIATDLKDACSSVDITIPPTSVNTSRETESWTERIAQCSFDQFLSSAMDADISDFHIIRALAAAGISELVFESRFPDFLARESPLLDQYRSHILATAGPQKLYQLDLLACNSVMSEAHFTSHILQDAATTLSEIFCTALTPLVSPNNQTIVGAEPYSPSSPEEEDQLLKRQPESPVSELFAEAFVRALTLKQQLVLSRNKYKLVFFSPGDRFDPDTMIGDGDGYSAFVPERVKRKMNGWPRQHPVADDSRIKLCLFPALYSRAEGELTQEYGVGVTVKNCLVECDNFVRDRTDVQVEGFTLVVKGVVLVQ